MHSGPTGDSCICGGTAVKTYENHFDTQSMKLASLSWFTHSISRYRYLFSELLIFAVVMRFLGIVQPFAFQAIIDRVLPYQREATLTLVVVVLVLTTLLSAGLDAVSSYLGNHMANRLSRRNWQGGFVGMQRNQVLQSARAHAVRRAEDGSIRRIQSGKTVQRENELEECRLIDRLVRRALPQNANPHVHNSMLHM